MLVFEALIWRENREDYAPVCVCVCVCVCLCVCVLPLCLLGLIFKRKKLPVKTDFFFSFLCSQA